MKKGSKKSILSNESKKYSIILENNTSDLDFFGLVKPDSNHICEANFLITIFHILTNIHESIEREKLKTLEERCRLYMYETEALNCILDKLEVFCKNKILWFDPQNEFSQINKFRQKSTRELYIIDYLIMI